METITLANKVAARSTCRAASGTWPSCRSAATTPRSGWSTTRCFLAALRALPEFDGGRVCHGIPLGNGGNVAGRRYWHAWVEYRSPTGWKVVDRSNGKQMVLDRAVFYSAGRVDPRRVRRYSPAEALVQVDRWGHAGPWMPTEQWDAEEAKAVQPGDPTPTLVQCPRGGCTAYLNADGTAAVCPDHGVVGRFDEASR